MTSTTLDAAATGATKPKTSILKWLLQKIEQRKETQRTYEELSRLDDRALRDLGIRREDIHFIAHHGRLPNE